MTQGSDARFLLREAAVNDLDELASYIQQDSPQSAIRFLEAAQETFELLAQSPELGGLFESQNPHLSGMRIWQIKGFRSVLVFYRRTAVDVEIVRVLHSGLGTLPPCLAKKATHSEKPKAKLKGSAMFSTCPCPERGGPAEAFSSFGFSATKASLVNSSVATLAAFCKAVRVTFVGSITPAFTRSS